MSGIKKIIITDALNLATMSNSGKTWYRPAVTFDTSSIEQMCQSEIKKWFELGYEIGALDSELYYNKEEKLGRFDWWHEALPTLLTHSREKKINEVLRNKNEKK